MITRQEKYIEKRISYNMKPGEKVEEVFQGCPGTGVGDELLCDDWDMFSNRKTMKCFCGSVQISKGRFEMLGVISLAF